MTASLRLFMIETRRNAGIWLFPVLVGLAWYAGRDQWPDGVTIWSETSFSIGNGMALAGATAGGLAAHMGGRTRRRGMSDLLATTPRAPVTRELVLWGATASWGVIAYLLAGTYLLVEGYREATWGGPEPLPIIVGLLVMVAYPALGYAAGSLIASRFVLPAVPIVLFLIQITLYNYKPPTAFLSPSTYLESGHSVFIEADYAWGLWLVVWLTGLAGTALGVAVAAQQRTRTLIGGLGIFVLIMGSGAVGLLSMKGAPGWPHRPRAVASYEPSCTGGAIPVCVHPAYEAILDETAAMVGPVLAPLAGITGAPTRAEQRYFEAPPAEGVLPITVWAPFDDADAAANMTARAYGIAADGVAPDRYSDPNFTDRGPGLTDMQGALILWLLRQANPVWAASAIEYRLPLMPSEIPYEDWEQHIPEVVAATDRFEALQPAQRRVWLETHFAALQSGEATIEDLP